jgi:hypothetical protein
MSDNNKTDVKKNVNGMPIGTQSQGSTTKDKGDLILEQLLLSNDHTEEEVDFAEDFRSYQISARIDDIADNGDGTYQLISFWYDALNDEQERSTMKLHSTDSTATIMALKGHKVEFSDITAYSSKETIGDMVVGEKTYFACESYADKGVSDKELFHVNASTVGEITHTKVVVTKKPQDKGYVQITIGFINDKGVRAQMKFRGDLNIDQGFKKVNNKDLWGKKVNMNGIEKRYPAGVWYTTQMPTVAV